MHQNKTQVQKNSKLSVISIILIIIGICIGSGIFYKNQSILQNNHGSILLSMISWIIVGVSTIFVAIALIEVCSIKYDRSALGILAWVKTFNHRFIYKCGKYYMSYVYWPTLLYGLSIYFVQSICLGLDWSIPWYWTAVIAFLILTWFTFVSGIFAKAANITNWIITCFKFLPLIFAILIGYIYVGIEGNIYTGGQITQHPQGWLPFKDVNPTPLFNELNLGFGMISTFPAILFALNGFQFVPSLQHEMKKPNKLSFAMNVGLIIVLVIYIALSMSMMLCSDGSIRGLSQWMEQHKLKWLYITIQLLISVGVLSVINGSTATAARMYEDLIIHNELICSHKFNKSKSSVFRPLNGALYFYIVLMMFFVVLTVAGLFFVDDSGIPFLKGLKTGGIFTLTNVVTNWSAMFFFVFTVLPIVGCLKNRKTNKIPVTKHRLFLFSAFVSIALVSVTTLDMLASSLSNPFIVGAYLDDNKYHDSANGWAELVTTILTLLILLISIAASVIPAIVESNRKLVKNLNKRKKRDVK